MAHKISAVLALILTVSGVSAFSAEWKKLAECTGGTAGLVVSVDQAQPTLVRVELAGEQILNYFSSQGALLGATLISGHVQFDKSTNATVYSQGSISAFYLGQGEPVVDASSLQVPNWNRPFYRQLSSGGSVGATVHQELVRKGEGFQINVTRTYVQKCSSPLRLVWDANAHTELAYCDGQIVSRPDEAVANWYFNSCKF